MTKKESYIARVKKGMEVYAAMEALENNEELTIVYGKRGEFKIRCHVFENTGKSYTINDGQMFGRSMNIDMEKSGKSYLHCYTFDLFTNQTIARLNFDHITIVETKEEETK